MEPSSGQVSVTASSRGEVTTSMRGRSVRLQLCLGWKNVNVVLIVSFAFGFGVEKLLTILTALNFWEILRKTAKMVLFEVNFSQKGILPCQYLIRPLHLILTLRNLQSHLHTRILVPTMLQRHRSGLPLKSNIPSINHFPIFSKVRSKIKEITPLPQAWKLSKPDVTTCNLIEMVLICLW